MDVNACISVIVPVYNVKNYLDECMESILSQTYANLEIILIDDGSTDGSKEMCDEWAGKDERIRVLHQENGGLSAARNAGLDVCRGEWIIFVDSDDTIPNDAVKTLFHLVISQKAEIGQGFSVVMGEETPETDKDFTKLFSGTEFLESRYFRTSAWGKIYHRTIWDQRRFRKGIIHEDYDIMYRVVYETERIGYTSRSVYQVRERIGSITRSGFSEKKLVLLAIDEEKIAYYREREEKTLLEQAYKSYYSNLLHLYRLSKMKCIAQKYRRNFKYFIRIKDIGLRTKAKLAVCYICPGMWER